jgi:hypothetical protein
MATRSDARNQLKSYTVFVRNRVDCVLSSVQDDTWSRYEQMAAVAVWKIVALSCDLDPDALLIARTTKIVAAGKPGSEAVLKKVLRLAIPVDKYDDYRLRWTVTVNCLRHGAGITPQHKCRTRGLTTVQVGDFTRFADTKGWELPDKLRRIGRATEQADADIECTKPRWEIPGTIHYWAREIGNAYIQACKKNKQPWNNKSVANHVADRLKERGLKGPRHYWSAETVKREALPGIAGRMPNGRK